MTQEMQRRVWRDMLRQSFAPRQWFEERDWSEPCNCDMEVKIMWVYRKTESSLWSVGFYSPDREWHPESDHSSKEAAAQRVHWLNGGAG